MEVMIIVPHPDDEVLGFGGTIQKHIKNGDNVFVLFFSEATQRTPDDRRRLENQISQFPAVADKLGYTGKSIQSGLDEKNFFSNVNLITDEIERIKPDILYTVFNGDNHQDHEYIFKAVKIATRVWSNFLVKQIYLGEILSSTDQSPKLPQFAFIPTHYIPLTEEQVKIKAECLKLYGDEIKNWPHPRSEGGIFNLAEKRGSECGTSYAESFVTLRRIENF